MNENQQILSKVSNTPCFLSWSPRDFASEMLELICSCIPTLSLQVSWSVCAAVTEYLRRGHF